SAKPSTRCAPALSLAIGRIGLIASDCSMALIGELGKLVSFDGGPTGNTSGAAMTAALSTSRHDLAKNFSMAVLLLFQLRLPRDFGSFLNWLRKSAVLRQLT